MRSIFPRHQRRNIGALKLSNLLQLDRFEEDLHISRVRLSLPATSTVQESFAPPSIQPAMPNFARNCATSVNNSPAVPHPLETRVRQSPG